jgi:hypothetical protein
VDQLYLPLLDLLDDLGLDVVGDGTGIQVGTVGATTGGPPGTMEPGVIDGWSDGMGGSGATVPALGHTSKRGLLRPT